MRAFIGIDFSREAKNGIAALQRELRRLSRSGRWKYVDNFHLTLKFLDEIDMDMVKRLDTSLTSLCRKAAPFCLAFGNLGTFMGKRGDIRVLWLGLKGDMDRLYALQESVETSTRELGFQSEKRRFTPHITLGQDIVMERELDQAAITSIIEQLPEIYVDRLILFKSEQVLNKRIYSPVSEYMLG